MMIRIRESLKNQKGFTLMELMTVIAIIAILAAIAVPRFASATNDANATKILADLRTIDSAIAMFFSANNRFPTQIDELAPVFLPAVPVPPAGWGNAYRITGNGANPPNAAVIVIRGTAITSNSTKAAVRTAVGR